MHTSSQASLPAPGKVYSLRLRLLLWYGTLLTVALGLFAFLLLFLTTGAINDSVDSAIRAEARIASLEVSHELSSTAPYWPTQLSLPVINTYSDPGVVIQIVDLQGNLHYPAPRSAIDSIPVSDDARRTVPTGQTTWYTTTVSGQHVRVEALPIQVPQSSTPGKTEKPAANAPNSGDGQQGTGSVIGILLVAKSLSDVDATLFQLQTLLLLLGVITLLGTLVGSWLLATRVLHPLSELMITARAIATSTAHGTRLANLSWRVRQPGGRDEMAQVVETFNEMLASLESATQAQRRFVADASHELRAPLTTIQGNLAFLQRHANELPPEERHTMLADAHEETIRLAGLVEELLLLARTDASIAASPATHEEPNLPPARTEEQSLIELDRTVIQLVRQLRRRLSVEKSLLKLEVGHIEPVRVRGDEENLRRIILILLDNAIKYTPLDNDADSGRVIVSLQRLDGQAVLRVRDTGIGIDPLDLPHIFERFYRADRARSRQGTGLGLAIAQTLTEQLGGRITAESTPGQGSTFTIWLPLA